MAKHTISIEIDDGRLTNYTDSYLAMLWHLAQHNPAPFGDHNASELVERIGREIIRRWLAQAPSELWNHQGRNHFWNELRKVATYKPPEGVAKDSPEWHNGTWTPRDPDQADDADDAPDYFYDQGVADQPVTLAEQVAWDNRPAPATDQPVTLAEQYAQEQES